MSPEQEADLAETILLMQGDLDVQRARLSALEHLLDELGRTTGLKIEGHSSSSSYVKTAGRASRE
jgi:hypothetical protein